MATRTWDGGGADNLWSTAANWSSDTVPVGGDDVVFDATSTKNCTIDPSSVSVHSITCAAGYGTGVLTATAGITITLGGDLVMTSATTIVFGVGTAWNIAGSIDPNTAATQSKSNYAGSVINLSGAGKTWGIVSSISVTPSPGVVNVLLGASYDQSNGEIGGIDLHNYGTLTASSELNINRGTSLAARIYNHSTGVFSGAGTIIFTANAQWIQQDGSVTISMGIIAYQATMSLVPATYACPTFVFYRQGGGAQTFKWSAGTYNFTGTASVVATDDGSSGTHNVDNSAGAILNFSQATFDLTSPLGGVTSWTTGPGKIVLKNAAVNLKCNGLTLDTIEPGSGSTITLGADLFCTTLNVVAGTLNANGKNITTTMNLIVANPGQFTPAGLNGSTITVQGSLLAQGVNGTNLNWQATAGWTLNVRNSPINTANASYVSVKNCDASGGKTVLADHSTDAGSNTHWTFSNATRLASKTRLRVAQSLSAGVHTLEVTMSGTTLSLKVDSVAQGSYAAATANQTATKHGVHSYYDGTYQQCPLDVFQLANAAVVPDAPTGFTVSATGLCAWHASTGAASYSLERAISGSGSYSVIASPTVLSFQDTLTPNSTYDYRVRAVNASGNSAYSSVVTLNVPALVAYWTLDEASGNRADSTGNGHAMIPINAPSNAVGKIGNAVNLVRASNQDLYVADHTDFNSAISWSVAGWVKQNAGQADFTDWYVMGKGYAFGTGANRGWFMATRNASHNLIMQLAPADGGSYATISIGAMSVATWHFIAASWDAVNKIASLSLDGAAASTVSISAGLANTTRSVCLGANENVPGGGDNAWMDGLLDEWAFFSGKVLSVSEISQLYNSGNGVTYPLPF